MKSIKLLLLSFGFFILSCHIINAQQTDTMAYKENSQSANDQENISVDAFKKKIFEEYNIKEDQGMKAKVLEEFEIRTAPSCDSETSGTIIPENSIVEVFNYVSENSCWVVKYGNTWGFIKDDIVFPISDAGIQNKVSKFDVPPRPKSQINPKYPSAAKKKGIKGKVYLKVFIDESGEATEVIVLRGIEELNQAAVDAIKKVKYQPAEYKGEVVGVWVNLSITF